MKLRKVMIRNFRSLVDLYVPMDDTTVLIGENNSGKTAFLDALRTVLTPRSGGRATPFNEYDYHMTKKTDTPESSEGIEIELVFSEGQADEWPESLIQALTDIVQIDPVNDIDSIRIKLWSKYDPYIKEVVTRWEFADLDGNPLQGKGALPTNLSKFLTYIKLFYLSALRDSADEFSPRSQYWGRLIKDLKINDEKKNLISAELTKLNNDLLKEDPRLEQVVKSLGGIQSVLSLQTGDSTSVQALPIKPWDLMSKSEVVVKGRGSEIEFPLSRHGNGIQSLAVLFLFQAYIEVLLKPQFETETEAIIALEELETHLHPQAIRALAKKLETFKAQKIVSSHSPYFIQEIPFTQIRLFRRVGPYSKVLYIKRAFSANIPILTGVEAYCGRNNTRFNCISGKSIIEVSGKMTTNEYRDLISLFPGQPWVHSRLKKLFQDSQEYLSDEELTDLETYAKRIRGEILFARGWLLCEGQSEYMLLRYFAELMGKPFDCEGISVIDYQNNGSPGAFVSLARAFEIPWFMISDNDQAGVNFRKQVKMLGFSDAELNTLVTTLPGPGTDLELYLYENGFSSEYISILMEQNRPVNGAAVEWVIAKQLIDAKHELRTIVFNAKSNNLEIRINEKTKPEVKIAQADTKFDQLCKEIVVSVLREDKVRKADALIKKLKAAGTVAARIPTFFVDAINQIASKVV